MYKSRRYNYMHVESAESRSNALMYIKGILSLEAWTMSIEKYDKNQLAFTYKNNHKIYIVNKKEAYKERLKEHKQSKYRDLK